MEFVVVIFARPVTILFVFRDRIADALLYIFAHLLQNTIGTQRARWYCENDDECPKAVSGWHVPGLLCTVESGHSVPCPVDGA